jgi:hypothetical protein
VLLQVRLCQAALAVLASACRQQSTNIS